MENKKVIKNTVRGIPMQFAGHTRSLELCAQMNYETENLDFIDELKTGDVYYDLGACEGRFTLYAALKGIQCCSFEPEERNFQTLKENLALNFLSENKNVNAFQLAVGEKKSDSIIKIGQPWAGGHQKVVQHGDSRIDLQFDFKEEQVIHIVSLDEFIAENNLPVPDFMKIDIDGSEIPFLLGAKNTLSNKKVKKLLFELSKADANYSRVIELLKESGLQPTQYFQVPNEPELFNVLFERK